jgi:hypothetical protein
VRRVERHAEDGRGRKNLAGRVRAKAADRLESQLDESITGQ